MLLNSEVVAAATGRLERAHGTLLQRPTARGPVQLPPDRLARVKSYVDANRTPDDIGAFERAIGTNDLLSLSYFWAGLQAARSVGRILIAPVPQDPGGSATGFMIAPNLLLTNWHVFGSGDVAKRARLQFAYEADANGNQRVSTWFSFLPDRFFVNDKDLDYCVVAVDPDSRQGPDALDSFGWLRLKPELGKADYGQFLSIIQHPGGEPKQVAIRENKLLPFNDADDFLSYTSDTFRGSSGSPVLNDFWDVVALHHSGKPLKDAAGNYVGHDGQPITDHKPQENEIQWIANEGARTSKIVADLMKRAPQGEATQTLAASFKGQIAPRPRDLENASNPVATPVPPVQPTDMPVGKAPDGGFLLMLPLNVSLKVESLLQPPAPIPERRAVPAVSVSPIAKADAAEGPELEKLNFDSDYSNRSGYDEDFLGRDRKAAMPSIDPASNAEVAPTKKRGKILLYHHYSAMVHGKRRMPVLTACNVDYSAGQRKLQGRGTFGKDEWISDERMDERYQLPKGFYDRWKKIDYGHLVRRDDNCWGASKMEIEYANSDTFHLTNCTPQHEAFNRAVFGYHGLWGSLEILISDQAEGDRALARLCIFAGPIFTGKDPKLTDEEVGDVLVPLSFWKVVVAPTQRGGLRAFGFITSQKQDFEEAPPFEEFTPAGFEHFQVTLPKIEAQTIVRFSDDLKGIDAMSNHPDDKEIMPIESLDAVWLGRR
jgi:endonuclease G